MTRNKKLLIVLLALAVLTGGYFLYMAWAFPAERCEAAKHLDSPQMAGDCYACHMTTACVGCGICDYVCPVQAVEIVPTSSRFVPPMAAPTEKAPGGKA